MSGHTAETALRRARQPSPVSYSAQLASLMMLTMLLSLVPSPVGAQQTAPQPGQPSQTEKAAPDPKGQANGPKTEKPNRGSKTRREPERQHEPGCPAIGDKLELLV